MMRQLNNFMMTTTTDNDNGQTDDENNEEDDIESDNDSEEEDDEFQPGDIVWGFHGRQWYPGVLSSINNVPKKIRHKFKSIQTRYTIYWYGKEMYSLVTSKN